MAVCELDLQHAASIQGMAYVASVVWLGAVGLMARNLSLAPAAEMETRPEAQRQVGLSTLTVLTIPLLGGWAAFAGNAPASVRTFRLAATLIAIFVCSALAFFRQHLVHQERTNLVKQLSASLDNVNRLQTQFVQSEKLAALGQLAAGAAHEINNPGIHPRPENSGAGAEDQESGDEPFEFRSPGSGGKAATGSADGARQRRAIEED